MTDLEVDFCTSLLNVLIVNILPIKNLNSENSLKLYFISDRSARFPYRKKKKPNATCFYYVRLFHLI